ncbi:MAG: tyrosine--tRNA ligase [Verrucomicrobia bacterium]|nr:tyrosine--tRNA ligase [Verrucomicrobiota bacterium]
MKKNLIDCLVERGFVDQITSEDLKTHLDTPRKVYAGFDPTADSLHLGNLIPVMGLAWFQKFGHTPVAIVGGGTGRIGDPSGKSNERPLLSDEILDHNVRCLEQFFHKILPAKNPKPMVINNNDWLGKFSLIGFLRDVAKLFRVGPMLAKESVRARIQSEEGMSFTEFSYQIMQAYDFAHLNQKYGVTIQLGASDQWGNITAGTEYNRKIGGETIYGLTFPLLTRSDGKKFGKSEEGAIWLSANKLSPYQFYQHLVRFPDADVIKMLKMLTFLDMEEIREIERQMPTAEPNFAQKRLAKEVTLFVHGEEGLEAALRVTEGIAPGSEAKLTGSVLRELASDMPHAKFLSDDAVGQKYVDLVVKAGLLPSKSEAVRLIKNGGAYLNNEKITDPAYMISTADLIDGSFLLLSAGKKKRMLISVV